MTKKFMDENFLLESEAAEKLYHEHASKMPIFDYHSHIQVPEICCDKKFSSITEAWLGGDHYKWRLMRTCGVSEELITGGASDIDKFRAWAEVIPQAVGNPVYQWTHLELQRFFGITEQLSPKTADAIFAECNEFLASDAGSVRALINKSNVKVICSTDDPCDTLEDHRKLAGEDWGCRVYPTWRPDKALAAGNAEAWNKWTDRLAQTSGIDVTSYDTFIEALSARHKFFEEAGCRLSDYGIEKPYALDYTESSIKESYKKVRAGNDLCGDELDMFRSALLFELLKMDGGADWTQQLHFGAARNPNTREYNRQGPDRGYDTIGDFRIAPELLKLLDRLESAGKLTRTILYTLNPKDNDFLASVCGSFMDGRQAGKIQFGTAWWFNDHKVGMTRQMEALSSIGMLSKFVGMLTDSRSFLSYPRHEYFRRLLCNFIGSQIEQGEIPEDYELTGKIVEDISFGNASKYFKLAY